MKTVRRCVVALLLIGLCLFITTTSYAQGGFSKGRLISKDGRWFLPVASGIESSNSADHHGRGGEYAVDLSAVYRAPVRAMASGVVDVSDCKNAGNRGCQVWVNNGNGIVTIYGHLLDETRPDYLPPITIVGNNIIRYPKADGRPLAQVGDRVDQNTVIGRVSLTGMTAWTHVHFVIMKDGVSVEPENYFDTSKLTYCLCCETSEEWTEDKEYNPFTLQATNMSRQVVSWVGSGQHWLEIFIIVALIVIIVVAIFNFGLVVEAAKTVVEVSVKLVITALRLLRQVHARVRRRRWWGAFKWALSVFLSAAIPAVFCAVSIWAMETGTDIVIFAQNFKLELISRVPFRGIPNNSGVAWLPDSVAYWWPEITAAANRHGVEPALLADIVIVESCGNPEAVSPSGAVGLLGIQPLIASGIVSQRGISGHTAGKLVNPEYNLDFGSYYLAQQMKAFGSVIDAAGAYNGGPGTMGNYLKKGVALPTETIRYRDWVTGLWNERNLSSSPTLNRWLAAGGQHACNNAAIVLKNYPPR